MGLPFDPLLPQALPNMMAPGPSPEPPERPGENAAASKAIAALDAWLRSEQDPQDKAVISGLIQKAHTLQAQEAKEKDSALGVTPAMKFVRRQNQKQA